MPKGKNKQCRPARGQAAIPAQRRPPNLDLVRGIPGPADCRIRLARPTDEAAVRRLLPLAEPGIDEEGAMLARSPRLAAGILRGLRQGADAVLRDTNGRSLQDVFIGL